ncbi:hypothetical protein D3C71_2086960 [compost metagenome]
MNDGLLAVQYILQLMHAFQGKMLREIFDDLLLQHTPQKNNLLHRLQINIGNQISLLGINIDIRFQTELLQHIAQRGP